ncbi:MAG: hypothetical protein ACRDZ3_15490 [Acidimicrobiia bacterium]
MNMKKHLAVGIAAAVLGVSGVAGAVVSVNQLTSLAGSAAGITASTDALAANCWLVTGSNSDAGCNTSVAGLPVPALPEIPNLVPGLDIPDATGLLAMATGALDSVTGGVGDPLALATGLVPTAQNLVGGAIPSACGLSLPVPVPVPTGIFSAGLNLFHMAQNLAMNDLGVAGLASPVALPVALPVTPDDVINTVEEQVGCLSEQAGGLPIPNVCTVNAALPEGVTSLASGLPVPTEISGLLNTVVSDLAAITGQTINMSGGNVGANCNVDGALAGLPIPDVTSIVPELPVGVPSLPAITPAAPALPSLDIVNQLPVPAVSTVTDTVTGAFDTVTGLVDGLLRTLPVDVPALPLPVSTPSCSASASASGGLLGGLLGSLTTTITGGCQ